ncbi:MAG: hypothetical protein R8L53_09965 [Mariprofundales bacterium]
MNNWQQWRDAIKKYKIVFILLIICLSYPLLATAGTDSNWQIKTDLQAQYGSYNKSLQRESITSTGLILAADYLERGSLTLAATASKVNFKTNSTITQQAYFASARYHSYFDLLPGKLTFRVDGHMINNNDITGNTDGVQVIAPQLSFINYGNSFYMDIAYTRSSYSKNLNINQYTPTLGFAFNALSDWLQIRGYFIDVSNPARAQNKKNTSAAEIKLTHWFAPDNFLGINSIQITALGGERIYAVDGDAAAVYNLADLQQGSGMIGLTWQLSESTQIMLLAGEEHYLDNTITNSYISRFAYTNLSTQW